MEYKNVIINRMLVKMYIYNSSIINENKIDSTIFNDMIYTGVLRIENIDLFIGYYEIDSKYNDISYGLEQLHDYEIEREVNVLILASHSGNSKISYFDDLKYLKHGDIASIYKEGLLYDYLLTDIIEISKSENVIVDYNNDESLILITCLDDNNYLIYTFEMSNFNYY
ncbi:MAG: sortase [bacterium]